jgi:hypothetical protein
MAAAAAAMSSAERLDKSIGMAIDGDGWDEDRWWLIKKRWITDTCMLISAGFGDQSKIAIYGSLIVLYQ